MPPRDSPPLPVIEDLRDGEGFAQQPLEHSFQQAARPQNNVREHLAPQAAVPNHHLAPGASGSFGAKNSDIQPSPMVRTSNTEQLPSGYNNPTEWAPQIPAPNKASAQLTSKTKDQPLLNPDENTDMADRRELTEAEGWDFSEGSFPEPNAQVPAPQLSTSRPDADAFPAAESIPKSPNRAPVSHRRKSSGGMSRRKSSEHELSLHLSGQRPEGTNFKLKFGLRGHLDAVRTVIFSGGGSPGEPEICTAGDDGTIKRFHIPDRHPGQLNANGSDLDVTADFTHRGHIGAVLSLASWSPSPNFSTGGRAQGDGWIFSGGQDTTIRVWERGRVDPKATIDAHTDAVWALCVLPTNVGAIFGPSSSNGPPDRILLLSGAADSSVKLWAVSAPPQLTSPQPGTGRRGPGGRVRGNSTSSGSAFPNSPQPTTASNSPFHHTLVYTLYPTHSMRPSPTFIAPLNPNGETFVVSYSDASIMVYDTRTGEPISNMLSQETYDGTIATGVNAVVATTVGLEQPHQGLNEEDSATGGGPTGSARTSAGSGAGGVIISGHEDRFIRFFDANSGKIYTHLLSALVLT